jgi:hypothetical protein
MKKEIIAHTYIGFWDFRSLPVYAYPLIICQLKMSPDEQCQTGDISIRSVYTDTRAAGASEKI